MRDNPQMRAEALELRDLADTAKNNAQKVLLARAVHLFDSLSTS